MLLIFYFSSWVFICAVAENLVAMNTKIKFLSHSPLNQKFQNIAESSQQSNKKIGGPVGVQENPLNRMESLLRAILQSL